MDPAVAALPLAEELRQKNSKELQQMLRDRAVTGRSKLTRKPQMVQALVGFQLCCPRPGVSAAFCAELASRHAIAGGADREDVKEQQREAENDFRVTLRPMCFNADLSALNKAQVVEAVTTLATSQQPNLLVGVELPSEKVAFAIAESVAREWRGAALPGWHVTKRPAYSTGEVMLTLWDTKEMDLVQVYDDIEHIKLKSARGDAVLLVNPVHHRRNKASRTRLQKSRDALVEELCEHSDAHLLLGDFNADLNVDRELLPHPGEADYSVLFDVRTTRAGRHIDNMVHCDGVALNKDSASALRDGHPFSHFPLVSQGGILN